jgi:hypothetical protein
LSLLVAYPELRGFLAKREQYAIRRWCLDSGAYSAHNSGKVIVNKDFLMAAREANPDEMFGLDVIGDPHGTKHNLEEAWAAGLPAIPTFHYGHGRGWEDLEWCAEHAPAGKIALGDVSGKADSRRVPWLKKAVKRCWPTKTHAFGCASREALSAAPFHSADASSWIYAPAAMGMWAGFTGRQMAVKSNTRNYSIEVKEHLDRERWATAMWAHLRGGGRD